MNKNSILIDLSESEKTRFGKEDFDARSIPQKVFSAIWAEAGDSLCVSYRITVGSVVNYTRLINRTLSRQVCDKFH